jgi:hypothetical protein
MRKLSHWITVKAEHVVKKNVLTTLLAFATGFANAGGEQSNVFIEALKEGDATTPLPNDDKYTPLKKALQNRTGDSGEIYIKAHRVLRFKQQARCGRVVFAITQPSKNPAWADLGGQLNICDDGAPPWRVCKDAPNILVPPNGRCDDKSEPQETAEVRDAIASALKNGGISIDQARKASKPNSNEERSK